MNTKFLNSLDLEEIVKALDIAEPKIKKEGFAHFRTFKEQDSIVLCFKNDKGYIKAIKINDFEILNSDLTKDSFELHNKCIRFKKAIENLLVKKDQQERLSQYGYANKYCREFKVYFESKRQEKVEEMER